MENSDRITRATLNLQERIGVPAKLFGVSFPLLLEPYIYTVTGKLAPDYHGGYWNMYALSNGGFYMAPATEKQFNVVSPNGYESTLSTDALGITACLYAYSKLSFSARPDFSEVCAGQYHLLRDYMLEQAGAGAVLRAID